MKPAPLPQEVQDLIRGTVSSFDYSTIFVGILFSLVGWLAWRFGRKTQSGRHMMLGVGLMAYAYFVTNVWISLGIGSALTLLLFWP